MRVMVDRELCEANGVCTRIAGEVFQLGDDDRLRVEVDELPATQETAVRAAVRGCPRQALKIIES